jgi:predicted DNA-binding protein (MmcQ/YjbR family)
MTSSSAPFTRQRACRERKPRRAGSSPCQSCRVDAGGLRAYCLSFSGAEQAFPFGPQTSVFKVAGKIFALSRLDQDPLSVSLKCEPGLAQELRDMHAAVQPGYHLNKRHWNTVTVDGSLPDGALRDMIEDSYDLVVSRLPRARRRTLGWSLEA